jgi:hypothetical protein
MRVTPLPLTLALCVTALAACGGNPQPAATTPQDATAPAAAGAPDQASLAGDWALQLIIQGQSNQGALRLIRSGDSYGGFMQLDTASQAYVVRSVQVQGAHVILIVDTTDGEARIDGNLRNARQLEAMFVGRHTSGRLVANRR